MKSISKPIGHSVFWSSHVIGKAVVVDERAKAAEERADQEDPRSAEQENGPAGKALLGRLPLGRRLSSLNQLTREPEHKRDERAEEEGCAYGGRGRIRGHTHSEDEV
jgi:hypothetical protein